MNDHLLLTVENHVATLTINRPERRNAISLEMISLFHRYLDQTLTNPNVRSLCLSAAGSQVFCAGADLGNMSTTGEDPPGPQQYAELLKRMVIFPKPIVAKVHAPCLAGGLGLMLACDLIIASRSAFFQTPEVNVGIFPYMVGALLAQNIPWKKTMDMALTGRKVDATEAEHIGLVSRCLEPKQLDQEVDKILADLCQKSPLGLKMGKKAFGDMTEMPLEEGLDYLCKALLSAIKTKDAREGMLAFLQKRKPEFIGE
ncbi:MAG: enoyl-CoA hydratase [Xanthomonadaceae bacterium]|nr:enoyl-CoA hydratase [Xanthomonadaceae bacterium]